jgi:long-subunit acyl-CoA synthetase (AMP-forming)
VGVSLASTAKRVGETLASTLSPLGERETIGALLKRNAARFGDRPIYLEKKDDRFEPVVWEDFRSDVVSLIEFLRERGVAPGDRLAVVSRNRGEMLATEFAAMSMGAVYVPIFAGYSAAQTEGLLRHSGASALVVGGAALLGRVQLPDHVRLVLSYDPLPAATVAAVRRGGGRECLDFAEALDRGGRPGADDPRAAEVLQSAARIDPGEPCLMMYTSGTAGQQKGVLLTHDNILSQQRALARLWEIGPGDRLLSYLPWHHSFGGIFEKYTALYNGAPLALDDSLGKDFPRLRENWKKVRPTVYFSVPLVHQELVSHVRVHPEDEDRIFHAGLKFVFTAAAPLPANISEYFAAKRIPVVEGWGLTETSPCCTLTDMEERRDVPGVVGYPIPGVELRLAGDGEILVRGPNVMRGYHADPEATARVLPGDGWFRTGDLGELAGSALRLLTRKDRVFKMLNAEKVIPTVMENRLAGQNKYIRHVLVVGDGRGFLAALVFPNFFLIEQEFGPDREKAERVVRESFRTTVEALNRENPVKYEHIQAFAVVDKLLTVEDGELTPSMKVRVENVLRGSREYVEAIYEPLKDCDCRFLRKVLRLAPDPRPCPAGEDLTLDRCHECDSRSMEDGTGRG